MSALRGVIPPMITPFTREGEVDYEGLETLVSYLVERVDGLYICGSYGSGPLMTVDERKQVAEVCVKTVAHRIPVIVHSGCASTRETLALTKHAEHIGATGAAAVGPYYYHHGEKAIVEFYSAILSAVDSAFPVYLYNNPKFSGYEISLHAVRKLKELGLAGIKDATFDMLTTATYMRELKDENFDVVLGTESMWLPACSLGATAFIPGLGNAFPELCRTMWQQGVGGNYEQCRKTQFLVNQVRELMYLAGSTQLAVYAMLQLRGVLNTYPRAPFLPAGDSEVEQLRESLSALGVL
jgi:dihydrodipicolinate synthase/N-acetylneuraminate lyase